MGKKRIVKIIAGLMGLAGLALIIFAVYPIVSYEIYAKRNFPALISPISENDTYGTILKDYTQASTWFSQAPKSADFASRDSDTTYTLSIPKLKIDQATVHVGGEDLSKSLIQYPQTAFPGEVGNTVIFGHSVLPVFFNPKNYMTIFSTLPKIKKGEEIIVNYDGVNYTYEVKAIFEVAPTDIQILEQATDSSYLTLVTCTPPGHPLKPKRLIVRAKIVD